MICVLFIPSLHLDIKVLKERFIFICKIDYICIVKVFIIINITELRINHLLRLLKKKLCIISIPIPLYKCEYVASNYISLSMAPAPPLHQLLVFSEHR